MQKRVDRYRPKPSHFVRKAKAASLSAVTLFAPVLGAATTVHAQDTPWHANSAESIKQGLSSHYSEQTNHYTVQWGDTVNTIAEAFNINANTLIKDNNISNANLIYAGASLEITKDRSGYVAAEGVVARAMAANVPSTSLNQQIDNVSTGLVEKVSQLQATPTAEQAEAMKQQAQSQGLVPNNLVAERSESAKSAELPVIAPTTDGATATTSEKVTNAETATEQAANSEATGSAPTHSANTETTQTAPTQSANNETTQAAPAQSANTETTQTAPAQSANTEATQTAPAQSANTETTQTAPAQSANNETTQVAPTQSANTETTQTAPAQTTENNNTAVTPVQPENNVTAKPTQEGVDVNKTVQWFYDREGKLTYSMYGSRNGTDGTADCSGAVTQDIYDAGGTKPAYLYNTDSLHGYLKQNGYNLIAENQDWQAQKGDVVIWGKQGQSGGAAGHVSIISTNDPDAKAVSVNYVTQGEAGTAVTEEDYNQFAQANGWPYSYAYRHANSN
ncbi:peptidoglycan amidohydrolase family protein [Leuconostoc mesenteroides]|uniref:peptidoglycan amidohydrolase family protein n=4 Tax=Leuconostoc mesenteroides TaxID=1245 RepID=UPI00235FE034|nr:peptidoglycan amidohydrolase family protein [Leuconostoc mesenteroides]